MSKASSKRQSKPVNDRAYRRPQFVCDALEQRTLLSVVIAPNFVNVPGQPAAETLLQDKGVRLIDPGIVLIFWGSYWGGTNTPQAQVIKNAVSNICNSGYFQETAQYGTGGAAFLSSASAYLSTNPPTGFVQANVDGAVDQAIASGQIGSYTFNRTIYEVMSPPGVNSGYPTGPSGFNYESPSGHVDAWCGTGATGTTTIAVDGFSLNVSHETAEGMTDPGAQGIEFTPPPSWTNGGSGNQIGDYEGNFYSFREPDGALVQPLWSAAADAWVATDGKTQNLNLTPKWSGNKFFGSYTLAVNGDQLGYDYNDTISLGAFNNGVQVSFNGETTTFDPTRNAITEITVNTGGGNNTVSVPQTLAGVNVSIIGGGIDVTNIGASGSVQNIFGQISVENTTLNVDDSADGVERIVELSNGALLGLAPADILWPVNDLDGLTISEGAGGNHIYVLGTGTVQGAGANTINAGSTNDVVNIDAIQGPLTVNGLGGPDTVNVTPLYENLDAIQGLLTLNGNGAIVNLDDQLNPNIILTTYAFSNTGFSRSALTVGFPQPITRNESIVTSGLGNVVLNAGPYLNVVNVEGDSTPITINASPTTPQVAISPNAENFNNVPYPVTVNGNGTLALVIEDQNNLSVVPVQNTLTASSLTSVGWNYVVINTIPVLLPFGSTIYYSAVAAVTFDAGTVANTYDIQGTNASATTTVNAGSGQSTVNVTATTGPLTINGQGGSDTVTIGNAGNTQSILGDVTVGNVGGTTALTVDDSADSFGRVVTIDASSVAGVAQGTIHYVDTGGSSVSPLTVDTGIGADVVNVSALNPVAGLSLNTGAGDDTVNAGAGSDQISGLFGATVAINGGAGADIVNVLDHASILSSSWSVRTIAVTDVTGIGSVAIGETNFETVLLNAGDVGSFFQVLTTLATTTNTILDEGAGNDTNTLGFGTFNTVLKIPSHLTINGGGGVDTLATADVSTIAPVSVHLTPTQIGAAPGDTLFASGGSLTYTGISAVTLTTSNAPTGDTIAVTPSSTTAFTINGNNPSTSPGDTLTIVSAGVTNPVLTPNGIGAGQYTFSNRMPVTYTGIEQTSIDTAPVVAAFTIPAAVEGTATTPVNGSFTGPAGDSFTATVDYGDGAGPQALVLTGNAFTLSHAYVEGGAYAVSVVVTDTTTNLASPASTASVAISDAQIQATIMGAPATTFVGGSVNLSFIATNPDASEMGPLVESWTITDASNNVVASGLGGPFTFTPPAAGTYTVNFTASESAAGDAETGTATATITVNPTSPAYVGTQIYDGNRQRSVVRSLTFSFSTPVTLSAGAITLALSNAAGSNSGTNDGAALTIVSPALGTPTTSDGGRTWVVPFLKSIPGMTDGSGSLLDGVYTATIHGSMVTDAFGQHLTGVDPTKTFHRLYGDINGDKKISNADFTFFSNSFGSNFGDANYNRYFDFAGNNGRISNADFTQFSNRFGKTFLYTGN
ncbi:MAG: hypothetical protein JWL69_1508 [Phycisphaerales bacterium]|nr:hypothetical protein [Phycisphaerales bacterium]